MKFSILPFNHSGLPGLAALLFASSLFSALPANAQAVTLTPCHLPGMRDAVLCGSLPRPLNPDEPQGKQIELQFAVMPSKAREKHPDPIYFLAGGPGQSAMDVIPAMQGAMSRLNNRRDLVFVDQRGTGKSAPLQCEKETELSLAKSMDPAQLPLRMTACRTALEKLPYGDLRYFSTTIAMQDVDAVRAALGAEQINLIGASYGTRTALEYLRLFPQRVRRMVIDGVAPASMSLTQTMADDANAALQSLFTDCAADADCAKRHPQLAAQWDAIFASLPQTIAVNNPLTGAPERVTVTGPMVASMVRGPLYAPQSAAGLPQAIDEAAQGRWTPLIGLAGMSINRSGTSAMAMGMHFSVICGEDPLRTASAATAGHFAGIMDASYTAVCAQWPRSKIDPAFYTISPSTAPVLMFSGGIDPATPPQHAIQVAKSLGDKVRHVQVPKAGHGILRLGCTSDMVFKFIDNKVEAEALKIDSACLANIPRPTAFVPLGTLMQTPLKRGQP